MQTNEEYLLERLDKLGLYSRGVRSMLKKTQGVIAGSFPLQCLLREEYAGSDVDFFIPSRHKRTAEKWFQKYCGGQSIGDPVGNYPKPLNDQVTDRTPYMYTMDNITGVYKFIYKKACINLIFVTTGGSSMQNYVENNFDISFCKTMYDGRNLRFAAETLRKVGRTCYNKAHGKFQKTRTAERVAKYTARGFIIFEEASYQEQVLKTDPKYSDHAILNIVNHSAKKSFYNISFVGGDMERDFEKRKAFCRNIMTGVITHSYKHLTCVKFSDYNVYIHTCHALNMSCNDDFDGAIILAETPELYNTVSNSTDGVKPVSIIRKYISPSAKHPRYEPPSARAKRMAQTSQPVKSVERGPTPVPGLTPKHAAQIARITTLEYLVSRLISQAISME